MSYGGFPEPGAGGYGGNQGYGNQGYGNQGGYGGGEAASYQGGEAASYQGGEQGHRGGDDFQGQQSGEGGDRGLGTMALGGAAGWAANKATGSQHGNFVSIAGGAILAEVGKKVGEHIHDKYKDHQAHKEEGQYASGGGYGDNKYGGPQGGYGGPGGPQGGFGGPQGGFGGPGGPQGGFGGPGGPHGGYGNQGYGGNQGGW